jgi:Fur family ferric uptake transcriptional regulator
MKYSDYKKLLKSHTLRITDCRIDVLERFYNTTHALSFKNLEDALPDYDRVTLYRTLHSFIEKGLLHRIPSDDGFASYGLCRDECNDASHHHDHVHFKCNVCGHIECLPAYHVPKVELPGYEVEEQNLIVNGVCKICQKRFQGQREMLSNL